MGPPNRATQVNARDEILGAIQRASVPPSPRAGPITRNAPAGNLLEQFLEVLAHVGGEGVVRRPDQSLHEIAASLAGNGAAATVIRGRFAVAENGAVYVDAADLGERVDVVRSERLMVVVPATAVVATMHEAIRLMPQGSACGWFLSGPSKTADIEQSLVIGAQGARTLHVILE
jgi:L-lactate dehydrogenase complex protein LldG